MEGITMLNTIYNENCLDTMKRMTDDSVDLVVTSPPYDDLRDYNGYSFDFENIAKELYRVVKKGGKFAFQDLFLEQKTYGKTDDLLALIRSWGITKVEFARTCDEPFIPRSLKLSFMVGTISVIYGEK